MGHGIYGKIARARGPIARKNLWKKYSYPLQTRGEGFKLYDHNPTTIDAKTTEESQRLVVFPIGETKNVY